MDAINRYIQGDYVNIDTLNNLSPFKTLGGRTVYGGDGIMPDIFIPRDTVGYNSYYNTIANRRLDEQYAMVYSDMNREKLSSFETWQDLYKYLQYQPLLLNLVSYADNHGVRRRPYYIQESSELFENNLNAYIIRNFFGEEAFWASYYKEDPLLQKGIELIETGKTKRSNILDEKFK